VPNLSPPTPLQVAVIGSGLAGLAAAWLLARYHQVSLFERRPRPGFTASSVSVPAANGEPVRVDVPLRVFYPGYYPTLVRLYAALGVATEPVSYASSMFDASGQVYFRSRNLRWGGAAWSVVAPQDLLGNARFRRVALGLWRFNRQMAQAQRQQGLAGMSLADFAERFGVERETLQGFVLPAVATIATCNHAQALQVPATVVADYLVRGLTRESVRRAVQGADDVEQRLLAGLSTVRCGVAPVAVVRLPAGNGPPMALQFDDGHHERFDHVVFATQANQALRLLASPSTLERATLASFRYVPVRVVTHRDPWLMPTRRRDWSPVNVMVDPHQAGPESTIWVNAVQPALRAAADVFQTVNPLREPAGHQVIGEAAFERPLVDAATAAALVQLQNLHAEPERRVWFCGAYAQAGVPLLESAVRSALAVAERLGTPLPG
jgi:uncharacterized protein